MHPLKGTCGEETCLLHWLCHCGCGGAAPIHRESNRLRNGGLYVLGQPLTYIRGHNPIPSDRRAKAWQKKGVPEKKLEPLILYLFQAYGGQSATARALGVQQSRLSRRHERKMMRPDLAYKVLNHIRAMKLPADPWAEYEPRRIAGPPPTPGPLPASLERQHYRRHKTDPDPHCDWCRKVSA